MSVFKSGQSTASKLSNNLENKGVEPGREDNLPKGENNAVPFSRRHGVVGGAGQGSEEEGLGKDDKEGGEKEAVSFGDKYPSTSLDFDINTNLRSLIGPTESKIENVIKTDIVIKFRLSNAGIFKISDGDSASANLKNLIYLVYSKLLGTGSATPADTLPENKKPKYAFASTRQSVSIYSHLLDHFRYTDGARVYQDLNSFPSSNQEEASFFKIDLINFLANPKNQQKINEVLFNTDIVPRGGVYLGYTADIKHKGSLLLSKNILFDGFIKSCVYDFKELDIYEKLESVAKEMANSGKKFAEIKDYFNKYFNTFLINLADEIITNVGKEWGMVDNKNQFLFVTQEGIARAIRDCFIGKLYNDDIFKMYQKYLAEILEKLQKRKNDRGDKGDKGGDNSENSPSYNTVSQGDAQNRPQNTTSSTSSQSNKQILGGAGELQGLKDSGIVAGAGVTALLGAIDRDVANQNAIDKAQAQKVGANSNLDGSKPVGGGHSSEKPGNTTHSTSYTGPIPGNSSGASYSKRIKFADGSEVEANETPVSNHIQGHAPTNRPHPVTILGNQGQAGGRTLPSAGGIAADPLNSESHLNPATVQPYSFVDGIPVRNVNGDFDYEQGTGEPYNSQRLANQSLINPPEFAGSEEVTGENQETNYTGYENFQPPESAGDYKKNIEEAQTIIRNVLDNPGSRSAIDSAKPGANLEAQIPRETQAVIIKSFADNINSGTGPQEAILAAIRTSGRDPSKIALSVMLAMISEALPNISPDRMSAVLVFVRNALKDDANSAGDKPNKNTLGSALGALDRATDNITEAARGYNGGGGKKPAGGYIDDEGGRGDDSEGGVVSIGNNSSDKPINGFAGGDWLDPKTVQDVDNLDKFRSDPSGLGPKLDREYNNIFLRGDGGNPDENIIINSTDGSAEVMKAIEMAMYYSCQRSGEIYPLFTKREARDKKLSYRFVLDDSDIRQKILNMVNSKVGFLSVFENGFRIKDKFLKFFERDNIYYGYIFQNAKKRHNEKYYKPENDDNLPASGEIPEENPESGYSAEGAFAENNSNSKNGTGSETQGAKNTNSTVSLPTDSDTLGALDPDSASNEGGSNDGESNEGGSNGGGGDNGVSGRSSDEEPEDNNNNNGDGQQSGDSENPVSDFFKKLAIKEGLKAVRAWFVGIIAGTALIGLFLTLLIAVGIIAYCQPIKEIRDPLEKGILAGQLIAAPATGFVTLGTAAYQVVTGKSIIREMIDRLPFCNGADCETPGAVSGGNTGVSYSGGPLCLDQFVSGKSSIKMWKSNRGRLSEIDIPVSKIQDVITAGRNAKVPEYITAWVLALAPTETNLNFSLSGGADCIGIIQFCKSASGSYTYQMITDRICKKNPSIDGCRLDPATFGRVKVTYQMDSNMFAKSKEAQMLAAWEGYLEKQNLNCSLFRNRSEIYRISASWLGCTNGSDKYGTRPVDYGEAAERNISMMECKNNGGQPRANTQINLPKYSYSKDPTSPFSQIPTRKLIEMVKMSLAETEYLEQNGGYNYGINRVVTSQAELENLKKEENQKLASVAPVTAYIKRLIGGINVEAAANISPDGRELVVDGIPAGVRYRSTGNVDGIAMDSSGGGIDFAISLTGQQGLQATLNAPVIAPLYGQVTAVIDGIDGWEKGTRGGSFGNQVFLYYPSIDQTVHYSHLEKGIAVRVGDGVSPGTLLGRQGYSGSTSGNQNGRFVHISMNIYKGITDKYDKSIISTNNQDYTKFLNTMMGYYAANLEKIKAQDFSATAPGGGMGTVGDCPICALDSGGLGNTIQGAAKGTTASKGGIFTNQVRAFLDTIAWKESGDYREGIDKKDSNPNNGRYQIMESDKKDAETALSRAGIPYKIKDGDWSTEAQDHLVIGRILRNAQLKGDNRSLDKILADGDFIKALGYASMEFEALPTVPGYKKAGRNFSDRTVEGFREYYTLRLQYYESNPQAYNPTLLALALPHLAVYGKKWGEQDDSSFYQNDSHNSQNNNYTPKNYAESFAMLGEGLVSNIWGGIKVNAQGASSVENYERIIREAGGSARRGSYYNQNNSKLSERWDRNLNSAQYFIRHITGGETQYNIPALDSQFNKGINGSESGYTPFDIDRNGDVIIMYDPSKYISQGTKDEESDPSDAVRIRSINPEGAVGSMIYGTGSSRRTPVDNVAIQVEMIALNGDDATQEQPVSAAKLIYATGLPPDKILTHYTTQPGDRDGDNPFITKDGTVDRRLLLMVEEVRRLGGWKDGAVRAMSSQEVPRMITKINLSMAKANGDKRATDDILSNLNGPIVISNSSGDPQNTSLGSGFCKCPDGTIVSNPANCNGGQISSGIAPAEGRYSSGYGDRMHPILKRVRRHNGIDISAPTGTPIYSIAAGVVTFSGVQSGYGNMVQIKHDNGMETLYGHNSENLVKVGDRVAQGQQIAKMGSTGLSTGSHLHFQIKIGDKTQDPCTIIKCPPLGGQFKL